MSIWVLTICASILLHLALLATFRASSVIEFNPDFKNTIVVSYQSGLVEASSITPERVPAITRSFIGGRPVEPSERPTISQSERAILASSGNAVNTLTKSYLRVSEVETPAKPEVTWLLPFKYDYFRTIRSLEFQIWVDADGTVASVQLLALGPTALSQTELQEVVDWIRNTPMSPAINDGHPVPSTRIIEAVLDASVQ
jgi:hypothetical protein